VRLLYWLASITSAIFVALPAFIAAGAGAGFVAILVALVVALCLYGVANHAIIRSIKFGLFVSCTVVAGSLFIGRAIAQAAYPTGTEVNTATHQKLRANSALAASIFHATNLDGSTVICPHIEGSRVFLSVAAANDNGLVEIPQSQLTSFGERFLGNLGLRTFNMETRLRERAPQIREYFSQRVPGVGSKVVVVDGNALNVNFQRLFPDKLVLRTVSTDESLIKTNLQRMANTDAIKPANTAIINGIPKDEKQLAAVNLTGANWKSWTGIYETWASSISETGFKTSGSAANSVIEALSQKSNVLIIVAHSDGYKLYFPDGSSLDATQLSQIQQQIAANHPFVALFSCETAKVDDKYSSFAKSLIDAGAKAVLAPTETVGARTSAKLLKAFLDFSNQGSTPLEAWEKSLRETEIHTMETWIASGHAVWLTITA
jgi:hypothetical protein